MMSSSPAFMRAMISGTGSDVVSKADRLSEIGGMIATPSGMNGSSATSGWARMYVRASGNVFGRTATTAGSVRTELRDGVSKAPAIAAADCVSFEVRNWMSCQAASLFFEYAFIQVPNGWTRAQLFGLTGWQGSSQKAVSAETLDLFGSRT